VDALEQLEQIRTLEVEQHRGSDERSRETAASGLVGTGDESPAGSVVRKEFGQHALTIGMVEPALQLGRERVVRVGAVDREHDALERLRLETARRVDHDPRALG
jgi:hypothetical protein